MKQINEERRGDYFIKADEILGQGSFGKTLKCRKQTDDKEYRYCIKIISKQVADYEKQKMAFRNEIEAVKNLMNHYCENVTEIIDVFEDKENVYIIMELCDMDLGKEFQDNLSRRWYSRIEQINIMKQIIHGMKHLFKKNMIHRDIKPQNILIKKYMKDNLIRKVYKISDFGFCRTLDEFYGKTSLTRIGTREYCAPQLFSDGQFSGKCDIFSLGILFHQICYDGELPSFARYHNENELLKLKNKPFKCTYLDGQHAHLIMNLIEKMLAYDEDHRIKFEDIFRYELFNLQFPICDDPLIVPFSNMLYFSDESRRIEIILEIFYKKFQFCEHVFQEFENEFFLPTCESEMAKFFILLIGQLQLTYAMGMIHMSINDMHRYFLNNDVTHLLEILLKFESPVKVNMIKKTYFQQAFVFRKFKDDLKKLLLDNTNQEYLKTYDKCLQQRFQMEYLRRQLKSILYHSSLRDSFEKTQKNFKQLTQKLLDMEERFDIKNYYFINLDQIY